MQLEFEKKVCGQTLISACCALPVLVAQLDKASDYESEDWGFKSLQGYLLLFLESEKISVEESYAQAGPFHAWMPEWSKGADLRSAGQFVRLGSNPSPGSIWGISSIGRVRALQARGTGIETPMLHFATRGFAKRARGWPRGRAFALVAQLVEHGSNKPRVGGSSPSWSISGPIV